MSESVVIAMDLGTSGLRAQALNRKSGDVLSAVVTLRHPLPGANVIDHLHFALDLGVEVAQAILVQAVNRVIRGLGVEPKRVERLALCGNPIQMSLFQGLDVRDLAYAGVRKQAELGVVPLERQAVVLQACEVALLELPGRCEVVVPPAVRHEVGADALALIIQTGLLEHDETALATDFGTNAEMALLHEGRLVTASAAAGPALEGQSLAWGMLAAPGAVCDLMDEEGSLTLAVLDGHVRPVRGATVDLKRSTPLSGDGPIPTGITGTGVVALVQQGMARNLVCPPRILTPDQQLHLGPSICLSEEDLREAGKAVGAVRAGYLTLCHAVGIGPEDVAVAYMSGASGTYVDAVKAQQLGLVPPAVRTVHQVGNTSLAMARDLAMDLKSLEVMSVLAKSLKADHCMLATSPIFKKLFLLEFSYWTEGMPMEQYRRFLRRYQLRDLPPATVPPLVCREQRVIDELGTGGVKVVAPIGNVVGLSVEGCIACDRCVKDCPEGALSLKDGVPSPILTLDQSLCCGMACRRCERVCSEHVFVLRDFFCAGEGRATCA